MKDESFIEKFFDANLFKQLSEIEDFQILSHYFAIFKNYFNLKRYADSTKKPSSLFCKTDNTPLYIYIKDKENVILKCRFCNEIRNEKIIDINNEVPDNIEFSNKMNVNYDSFFNYCNEDINYKYNRVFKIINNIKNKYYSNNILLQKTTSNIIKYFFNDLSILLNLFLFSIFKLMINIHPRVILKMYF